MSGVFSENSKVLRNADDGGKCNVTFFFITKKNRLDDSNLLSRILEICLVRCNGSLYKSDFLKIKKRGGGWGGGGRKEEERKLKETRKEEMKRKEEIKGETIGSMSATSGRKKRTKKRRKRKEVRVEGGEGGRGGAGWGRAGGGGGVQEKR